MKTHECVLETRLILFWREARRQLNRGGNKISQMKKKKFDKNEDEKTHPYELLTISIYIAIGISFFLLEPRAHLDERDEEPDARAERVVMPLGLERLGRQIGRYDVQVQVSVTRVVVKTRRGRKEGRKEGEKRERREGGRKGLLACLLTPLRGRRGSRSRGATRNRNARASRARSRFVDASLRPPRRATSLWLLPLPLLSLSRRTTTMKKKEKEKEEQRRLVGACAGSSGSFPSRPTITPNPNPNPNRVALLYLHRRLRLFRRPS